MCESKKANGLEIGTQIPDIVGNSSSPSLFLVQLGVVSKQRCRINDALTSEIRGTYANKFTRPINQHVVDGISSAFNDDALKIL